MNNLNIEYVFPTLFGFQDNIFSIEENLFITKKCYELSKNINISHNKWLSSNLSPKNSFVSHNLATNKDFSFFINKVGEKIHEFAKINNDYQKYDCVESWFNIYNSNNYQEPHSHLFMTYSAVYFTKAPKNSGKIVFMNPVINELGSSAPNLSTTNEWMYEPRDGLLLIFRSNVRHYVLHGSNTDDRISIALNYALNPQEYRKKMFGKNA